MKWAGYPATFGSTYPGLLQECSPDPVDGTIIPTFDRVLRERIGDDVSIIRRYRPKFTDIDRWLEDPDHAVVLLYWKSNEPSVDGHYVLIPGKTPCGRLFECTNDGPSNFYTRETLKRYVRNHSMAKSDLPIAWFLRRQE